MDTMWGFHAPLGNILGKVVGMARGRLGEGKGLRTFGIYSLIWYRVGALKYINQTPPGLAPCIYKTSWAK